MKEVVLSMLNKNYVLNILMPMSSLLFAFLDFKLKLHLDGKIILVLYLIILVVLFFILKLKIMDILVNIIYLFLFIENKIFPTKILLGLVFLIILIYFIFNNRKERAIEYLKCFILYSLSLLVYNIIIIMLFW